MTQQGFQGSAEEKFGSAGRVNGFLREFGPTSNMPNMTGSIPWDQPSLTCSTIRPPYRGE